MVLRLSPIDESLPFTSPSSNVPTFAIPFSKSIADFTAIPPAAAIAVNPAAPAASPNFAIAPPTAFTPCATNRITLLSLIVASLEATFLMPDIASCTLDLIVTFLSLKFSVSVSTLSIADTALSVFADTLTLLSLKFSDSVLTFSIDDTALSVFADTLTSLSLKFSDSVLTFSIADTALSVFALTVISLAFVPLSCDNDSLALPISD